MANQHSVKSGDIAIITKVRNIGKLVRVIRPYTQGEIVSGDTWDDKITPHQMWVVRTLGLPLFSDGVPFSVVAISACRLQPIRSKPASSRKLAASQNEGVSA